MTAPTRDLAALLDGPSVWHTIEVLEEVGSTNDVLADRAAAGVPAGLVIVADRQTAGRGRRGRPWEDVEPHRSLLVSALLDLPTRGASLVPLAAGVAVADAIRRGGAQARLKWPNDVLAPVDGEPRKCAGILVERHGRHLVVGMGINVDWRGVPREGERTSWGSVAEALESDVDRWVILTDTLRALEVWVRDLERDPVRLLATYRTRCTTLGEEVQVALPSGELLTGRAVDLTPDGALLVDTGRGRAVVAAGDVVHVRPVTEKP